MNYNDLIREIGHKGDQILWPNNSEPHNRRGFHVQEIIDAVQSLTGQMIMQIQLSPVSRSVTGELSFVQMKKAPDLRQNLYLMRYPRAVLCGLFNRRRHALAWVDGKIIDPSTNAEFKITKSDSVENILCIQESNRKF